MPRPQACPAGQGAQSSSDLAEVEFVRVPAGHGYDVLDAVPGGQKWPMRHVSDGAERPAEGHAAPESHGLQASMSSSRADGLNVPDGQTCGDVEAEGQKEPEGQGRHCVKLTRPVAAEKVPAGHGWPLRFEVPAGQV